MSNFNCLLFIWTCDTFQLISTKIAITNFCAIRTQNSNVKFFILIKYWIT